MYFAILGKTPQLSLVELELVCPVWLKRKGQVVFFDISVDEVGWKKIDPDVSGWKSDETQQYITRNMNQLAGIVKWGKVLEPRIGAWKEVSPLGAYDEVLEEMMQKVTLVERMIRQLVWGVKNCMGWKDLKK